MKKLLPLLLFMVLAVATKAQTTFVLTTVPCHNDGVLSVSFTGVSAPLTVSWQTSGTTGTTIIHTSVSGLTDVLTNYSGGPITVTAVDGTGATASGSYSGYAPFTICPVVVNGAPCPAPDTLTASVCSGGTGPFHYQWYDASTSAILGTMNPMPVPQGGIYGVIVTDAAGCTYGSLVDAILSFAFTTPSFSVATTTTVANCTNGTASVTTTGSAVPPLTYQWSTGATTPTIGSLLMGTYHVTVTDAKGCSASDYAFVTQAASITAPVVPTPASCAGDDGTVIAFGTGGTPPYKYVWSNGSTEQSQKCLRSGFYTVNVTDANGCFGQDGGYVGTSTPVVVTYTATPSLCTIASGTATLGITGGTPPYTTTWFTTPVHTSITATNLATGVYSYRVSDAAGCAQEGTVYVPSIDTISVSFLSNPAVCSSPTGSMTAYPTGGVAPYSFAWNTGATTATITAKTAGDYTVTVTDVDGCKATVTKYLPSNTPIGFGEVATPESCLYIADGRDTAVAWGGKPPYSYGWSTGGTTSNINALPAGPYWVHVTDANGCTTKDQYSYVDYDTTQYGCYCTINGTVYHDDNGNCVQEPYETGIPNMQIRISGTALGTVYTYTDANGYYTYKVPAGVYSVAQSSMGNYRISSCQSSVEYTTTLSGTGCLNTVNFGDTVRDTVYDMRISTWDYTFPVAGQTYSQVVVLTNDGNMRADSAMAAYRCDGQLYQPSFIPCGYFAGSNNYYQTDSVTSLVPGASKMFLANYRVPGNIPTGTTLTFKDTVAYFYPVSNWVNDNTKSNNVNIFSTKTTGSYNPEFKEVYPKGSGSTGLISYTDSVLEYMVHFQNTGNWPVINVMVIDTLDNNVEWSTLKPGFSSASSYITMTQSGSRKIAKFMFNDINLPTMSSDLIRSNCMFTYSVHIKPGLPVGTTIKNRSSIYFDYNAPVLTNYTLNTISSSDPYLSVHNTTPGANHTFAVYPNPASSTFNAVISSDATGKGDLKVCDITGKVLMTTAVEVQKGSQTITTDVTNLVPGIYFVSFTNNGQTETQKLIIMK